MRSMTYCASSKCDHSSLKRQRGNPTVGVVFPRWRFRLLCGGNLRGSYLRIDALQLEREIAEQLDAVFRHEVVVFQPHSDLQLRCVEPRLGRENFAFLKDVVP